MGETVSILLCTCDRPLNLAATIDSLAQVAVPAGWRVELIVVDTGCTVGPAPVLRDWMAPAISLCCLDAHGGGKSRGLNRAMAAARGDILLFTDDDIRFPVDWIAGMCRPIAEGCAEAVQGGIRIADPLLRPWMRAGHRAWFAERILEEAGDPIVLVGANMAVARHVLGQVPAFDTELGPGTACHWSEDTLFSWQLERAGTRFARSLEVMVEHHFDASRLCRTSFLRGASRAGRADAYLHYHWEHAPAAPIVRAALRGLLRLAYRRSVRRVEHRNPEPAPLWELECVRQVSRFRAFLSERRRPRNYDRFGLVKKPPAGG